jgi:hypothetical protein
VARVRKPDIGTDALKALQREEKARAKVYEGLVKKSKRRNEPADVQPRYDSNPSTIAAKKEAKQGNTAELLPYSPTATTNPERPRTLAAGYDYDSRTLRVVFRDSTPWEYYEVPLAVWAGFQRTGSPGRFINDVLNQYPYAKGDF